jgi:hypothetical protein
LAVSPVLLVEDRVPPVKASDWVHCTLLKLSAAL